MTSDKLVLAKRQSIKAIHDSVLDFFYITFIGSKKTTQVLKPNHVNALKRLLLKPFFNIFKLKIVSIEIPRTSDNLYRLDNRIWILEIFEELGYIELLLRCVDRHQVFTKNHIDCRVQRVINQNIKPVPVCNFELVI